MWLSGKSEKIIKAKNGNMGKPMLFKTKNLEEGLLKWIYWLNYYY